jgi:hypothetical protein
MQAQYCTNNILTEWGNLEVSCYSCASTFPMRTVPRRSRILVRDTYSTVDPTVEFPALFTLFPRGLVTDAV